MKFGQIGGVRDSVRWACLVICCSKEIREQQEGRRVYMQFPLVF